MFLHSLKIIIMTEKKVSFWRIFWPTTVAIILTSTIGWLLFFGIIGGLLDFQPKPYSLNNNTVLHMTLEGEIGEKGSSTLDPTTFKMQKTLGLSEIIHGLEQAKSDERIKGVYIDLKDVSCGYTTAREIRKAILDFNKSGKFTVAYNSGEVITQKEYYIASAAKEIYAFPTSMMEFIGIGGELSFFKGTLDKLEVEMQVIRGRDNDFKSAVEPYFRTNMSDSSRLQMQTYISSIWNTIREDISKDRKISVSELNEIAEQVKVKRAEDAVALKLIDKAIYHDEVMAIIRKKVGLSGEDKIEFKALEKYANKKFNDNQILVKADDPNIAVILAEGGVATDGDGLTSKEICKLFRDVRNNKSIKTVVFRINSPGGSALASDEIWREVVLTNKTKKVIVSMGDVAASGGYYIAAPASYIFAEPTTITGSIGVFGVIPYTGKMLENKLGLSFDRVSTNAHSVMSLNKKLSTEEFATIQNEVDEIYTDFLTKVSEGRKMSKESVHRIARGRVWTGTDALRIGLVDKLGGLKDAIAFAAKKAKITETKVLYYPLNKEDNLTAILESIDEGNEEGDEEATIKIKNIGAMPEELRKYYEELKKIESIRGIQMRMPYDIYLR